jgi:hypothetical protein
MECQAEDAMDDIAQARIERDMNDMRARLERAQATADMAAHSISTHEQVCSIRYDAIKVHLDSIPKLFSKIEGLSKHVYIGMGLAIAAGALLRYLG